jgi:hypothetical protein
MTSTRPVAIVNSGGACQPVMARIIMTAMAPDGRNLSGKRTRNPFIHEYLYRKVAAVNTGGELGNPDWVLKPLISEYLELQDSILDTGAAGLADADREALVALKKQPWWWLMLSILPPYRSYHQFGMTYATYRQMSTGTMTFIVGRDLVRTLYNTDYNVWFGELNRGHRASVQRSQADVCRLWLHRRGWRRCQLGLPAAGMQR